MHADATPEQKAQQTLELLNLLEQELKLRLFWEEVMPSVEALSSQQPFCVDTLEFTQWLQFILLPRMRALIDGGHPLPEAISITPMATEALKDHPVRAAELIEIIARFDELLSGKPAERD
ncbi:YqcC family protein [Dongshaea marina]|uniref:YqcC family protein n=1 Tax=Dongshaea marina TaxID=2047966 RepID=UPI000D3E5F04|nr:YqcC family protein [Dongshaea marina]